ncbi:MAG: PEP-CTERM sorting domain-containing protein [Candidatus Acidiferrum sp.]
MRTRKLLSAALVFLSFLLLAATEVRADGTDSYVYAVDGNTFTWSLPANPGMTSDNVDVGDYFTFSNVSLSENGEAMSGTFDFYHTNWGGGFDLWTGANFPLIDAYGPQLYTGPESAPTLLPGTFSVTDYGNDNCPVYGGTLEVIPTPEPSTLYMLAIGLALMLGFALLRKN